MVTIHQLTPLFQTLVFIAHQYIEEEGGVCNVDSNHDMLDTKYAPSKMILVDPICILESKVFWSVNNRTIQTHHK